MYLLFEWEPSQRLGIKVWISNQFMWDEFTDILTHFWSMRCSHLKTQNFSGVFGGYKMGILAKSGLRFTNHSKSLSWKSRRDIFTDRRHVSLLVLSELTHYSPVLLFYTSWKHQKTFVFRGQNLCFRNHFRGNISHLICLILEAKFGNNPNSWPYLKTESTSN